MSRLPQGIWNEVVNRRQRRERVRRPTAWIRVSVDIAQHPDVVGLPSHNARWAYIVVLTAAKRQPEAGTFRSDGVLGHVLGRGLRQCLPALLEAGLLMPAEDGSYRVHNWEQWQTAQAVDHTNAERQRRHRELQKAKRNGAVTAVTDPLAVTPSNGGPPLGDYVAVTAPTGEAPVTARTVEQRRRLAQAIREARTPDIRRALLATFERLYGRLYGRGTVPA